MCDDLRAVSLGAAASRAQFLWLVDLLQAQESPVEAPCFGLAPSWSGHLHVIQADYAYRNAPTHRRSASTRSEAVASP